MAPNPGDRHDRCGILGQSPMLVKSGPRQNRQPVAHSLRKGEEVKLGLPPKSVDASGIQKAQTLASIANGSFADVIAWLTQQQNEHKKEATGG